MIKRISLILVSALLVLALAGCAGGNYYPEIESSEEEKQVLITLSLDGESYDVRYELYRTLFLTYKSEIDGGNAAVWESADSAEYVKRINALIIERCAHIYSIIHLAEKCGLSPYSAAVDNKIRDYVKYSVDGYAEGDLTASGFGGDYDAYLKSLADVYMNYSVQALMFRYAIAYDSLMLYYYGNVDAENPTADMQSGAIEVSDEKLEAYYASDDSARVLLATINAEYFSKERAEELRTAINSKIGDTAVSHYIIGSTGTSEYDAINGMLLGKNTLDYGLSDELASAAHALSLGETSEVIEYEKDGIPYYYILYRVAKTDEYFDTCKADVRESYVSNVVGSIISATAGSLEESATLTDAMGALDHSKISMP